MSIESNLSYIKFLKESGINNFLQNNPNKYYGEKNLNNDIVTNNIEYLSADDEDRVMVAQAKTEVDSDKNISSNPDPNLALFNV